MKQETARETSGERSNDTLSRLSFADLPGQSDLFVDYQDDPALLSEFYPNAVRSVDELVAKVPEMLRRYTTDRTTLCDALVAINSSIGASQATFANIEKLRLPETVAVVTGQQAGLFTGPVYTIYKALSAIRMAAELEQREISAVPVFWGATEDHDFAEVAEAFYRDAASEPFRAAYDPLSPPEPVPVGTIRIDSTINSLIEFVFDRLPVSTASAVAKEVLSDAWSEGQTFGESFGRTLASLLGKYGIIYLDPLNPELKKMAAPMYRKAIEHSDEIVERLIRRGAMLAEHGYHAQVLIEPDYFPLFWQDERNVRRSLKRTSDGFYRAKDSHDKLTREDLLKAASSEPERLSPGVMLRAAVQDHLLPTACYFGGGAEVAYFAQNSVVYETLERPVTPILHRQSFTIVEAKQRRTMQKYDLDMRSLFDGENAVRLAIASGVEAGETAAIFDEAAEIVDLQMRRIAELSEKIDGTLAKNAAKRRQRAAYHIKALRQKTLLAAVRRNDLADRHIAELFSSLLPTGVLQERVLNIFDLIARHGSGVIDEIYAAVDVNERGHRIIYL